MYQADFISDMEVNTFFHMLANPLKETTNFYIISTDLIQLKWHYQNNFQPKDNKTNIYLTILLLVGPDDTDSVVYVGQPAEYDLQLGDYLEDLTNELDEVNYIPEFVREGSNNYAYDRILGSL